MMAQLLFIGTTELLLIGGMALLLFGGKKLPEMMRGLGQGVREFKKGVNEVGDAVRKTDEEAETPSSPSDGTKRTEVRRGDTPVAQQRNTADGNKDAETSNTADGNEGVAAPTNATDGRQGD